MCAANNNTKETFFCLPYTTWRGMESSRLSLPLPSSQQFTADAPQDPKFAIEPESSPESSSELPAAEPESSSELPAAEPESPSELPAAEPESPSDAAEPESSLESSSELPAVEPESSSALPPTSAVEPVVEPVTERIIDPNVIDHTRIEPDEDFIGDCIQRFRAFLLGLAPLAPLAARIGSGALPRVVILNALRMMASDMTLRIIIGDPPAGDTLVKALAAEHGVNLGELSAGEQIRCAKWLELFGSYFADQEIA